MDTAPLDETSLLFEHREVRERVIAIVQINSCSQGHGILCLIFLSCCPLLAPSGSILGSGDEGPAWRSQAEEGAGAPVQPAAHRVPAHSLWDAHGRHQVQTLQTAQSHGQCPIWTTRWYWCQDACLLLGSLLLSYCYNQKMSVFMSVLTFSYILTLICCFR